MYIYLFWSHLRCCSLCLVKETHGTHENWKSGLSIKPNRGTPSWEKVQNALDVEKIDFKPIEKKKI